MELWNLVQKLLKWFVFQISSLCSRVHVEAPSKLVSYTTLSKYALSVGDFLDTFVVFVMLLRACRHCRRVLQLVLLNCWGIARHLWRTSAVGTQRGGCAGILCSSQDSSKCRQADHLNGKLALASWEA